MSENLSPDPNAVEPAVANVTPKKPRKRKRRWLWRALIVLPILLVALVLLLPTLLSLGPVRAAALSIAGPKIAPNGRIQIDSWTFSWLGGQRIRGITLFDDQNAAVAHLNVETGASLLGLARGDLNIGETKVTGDFDARIDPATGRVNLLHILGADAAKPAEPTSPAPAPRPEPTKKTDEPAKSPPVEPIKVPAIKGRLTLALTGTVSSTDPRDKSVPLTKVEQADVVVDLNDIEKGVGIDGTISASVDGKPARILVKGTADAVENGVVISDPNKLAADLTATVEQLDLSLANVALAAKKIEGVDVAGVLGGKLLIRAVPGSNATLAGEALGIDGLRVVAPQLKGDTLALKRVDFPLNVAYDASTGQITIAAAGVRSDLASADVSGALPWTLVENLINDRPPGSTGRLVVKTDAPSYAAIAKMLPHVVALPEGVAVTGGGLTNLLTIDLSSDAAKATTALKLSAAGTRDGKPIELKQTTLDASADVALPSGLSVDEKQVRAFTIDLKSPFATINGGGKPTAMRVEGDADLTKLYADAAQFVEIKDIDFKGKLGFAVATEGDPTDLAKPLGLKLGFNATGLTFVQAGKQMLADDAVNGNVRALYKQTAAAHVVTVELLEIKSATGLLEAWLGKDPAWFAFPLENVKGTARTIGGEGEFHVRTAQVARLAEMFAAPDADPTMKLKRGVFDSVVTFGAQQGGTTYAVQAKADLTKLDVGEVLRNETLSLTADARLPAEATEVKAAFAVASNFVNMKGIADARLKGPERKDPSGIEIPLSLFERLRSVTAEGEVPSIAKLHGLATSFSPPAPVLDPKTNQPLPPMRVESGSATFKLTLAGDESKRTTAVRLDVPAIKDLSLTRGSVAYAPAEPITLSLTSDLTTDAPKSAEATVTSLIRRIVANLKLDAPGLASVQTTTPIELTGLDQPTPSAKGVLSTKVAVGPLGRLLAVVSGGEPMPIEASYAGEQTVATTAGGITLAGGGRLTEITPTGPDATALPEKLRTIELSNDLAYDLAAATASIKKLTVVAPQARDVLSLDAAGTIKQVGTQNTFENFLVKLGYDLPELWPLVQPIADPTGESIGKIEHLEGKYVKTFGVRGSYPTVASDGKTPVLFNEAIRSIVVAGDLQIDRAHLVDKGIEVARLSLPISIRDGVAKIASYNGKSPEPFAINSGTGDLGGLAVILTGEEPVLVDVTDKKLIRGATLNPIFANALGKYFNPIFPGATKANAQVEVTLTTKGLRLGKSLQTANSGQAKVVLSLLNLEIANPLGDQLLGGAVNLIAQYTGQSGVDTKSLTNLQGELRDATFTLDRGVVRQDVTFMLGNEAAEGSKEKPKLYAFGFNGDVRLSDLNMNMNASFPVALLKDKVRGSVGEFLQFAPDAVPVGLTGSTTSVRLNWDRAIPAIGESILKGRAARALGGGRDEKDRKATDGSGGTEKKSDLETIIGAIGGALGDKDKKDDQPRRDEPRKDEPKKKKRTDDD